MKLKFPEKVATTLQKFALSFPLCGSCLTS
jgi:hypothetical protein